MGVIFRWKQEGVAFRQRLIRIQSRLTQDDARCHARVFDIVHGVGDVVQRNETMLMSIGTVMTRLSEFLVRRRTAMGQGETARVHAHFQRRQIVHREELASLVNHLIDGRSNCIQTRELSTRRSAEVFDKKVLR